MADMAEDTKRLADSFYREFVQRDLLGYILPGYAIWFCVLARQHFDLTWIQNLSTFIIIFLLLISLGIAYFTGLAIRALGMLLGVVRDFPLGESSEEFFDRLVEFKRKYQSDSSIYQQRERYVALKHVSGTSALAILLGARFLNNSIFAIPQWFVWSIGIILLFAHWRLIYNQREFESRTLEKNIPERLRSPFFSKTLIDTAFNVLVKANKSKKR
jgi:hypothetical protein